MPCRPRPIAAALLVLAVALAAAAPAAAQSEEALRSFFEGRRVTLKIDMPGTSDGVDVTPDARRPLDYQRLGDRLKTYGAALHEGESAVVTLVKVKKDLIEFQLNGGGFGTFGDDTSTSVSLRTVEKSNRERELERRLDDEKDSRRRRDMKDELDDLRDRRNRENRRIEAERVRAEESKRRRVAEARLTGGSRFNLRYADAVPAGIRAEDVIAALSEMVSFAEDRAPRASSAPFPPASPAPSPVASPPVASDRPPRKGMLRADAERAFGRPVESADRREGSLTVARIVFVTADQRITAEFVEDVLVRYTITPK